MLLRVATVIAISALVGACQVLHIDPARETVPLEQLLSGASVFGEAVPSAEVADAYVLAPNDAMDQFVAGHIAGGKTAVARMARLLGKLVKQGYFDAGYDANLSQTAAQTFDSKRGNCLSFTNLFIALARVADLDARYQIVDVPPRFDADSGLLVRNTHINVLVMDAEVRFARKGNVTVDFNAVQPNKYDTELVSDDYALALFYNNRSVDYWRSGDARRAFAYLRKALETSPDNADLWVNLGAFYSKHGGSEYALAAHYEALRLKPSSRPAMAGLAVAYERLGDLERSEKYAARVQYYRRRNPYYHFALAQVAFDELRYDETVAFIDYALSLKRDDHRFHYLKGLAHYELGERGHAEASLERAHELAKSKQVKRQYAETLAAFELTNS